MKKLLATLVVAVLLAGVFSGCYMTKAGKLKDIVGTYELKSYSRSGDGAVNYMERDEIVCYLVVKDASSGYYIYKDKNNPLSVREVMITLTPDTEEPSKYEFVTYKLDTSSEKKLGYAGGGLNSTTYQSTGVPFTSSFDLLGAQIHTSYSRVDKATDLELLAALIYCEAGAEPYEAQLAVGACVINRMKHRHYPDTIKGVIFQKNQFTPAMSGKVARILISGKTTASCKKAAAAALAGEDNTSGCRSFRIASTGRKGIVYGKIVFFSNTP